MANTDILVFLLLMNMETL